MLLTDQHAAIQSSCHPCLLYSVLRTFIHDPLVEWGKVKGKQASMETTNEKVHDLIVCLTGNGQVGEQI